MELGLAGHNTLSIIFTKYSHIVFYRYNSVLSTIYCHISVHSVYSVRSS